MFAGNRAKAAEFYERMWSGATVARIASYLPTSTCSNWIEVDTAACERIALFIVIEYANALRNRQQQSSITWVPPTAVNVPGESTDYTLLSENLVACLAQTFLTAKQPIPLGALERLESSLVDSGVTIHLWSRRYGALSAWVGQQLALQVAGLRRINASLVTKDPRLLAKTPFESRTADFTLYVTRPKAMNAKAGFQAYVPDMLWAPLPPRGEPLKWRWERDPQTEVTLDTTGVIIISLAVKKIPGQKAGSFCEAIVDRSSDSESGNTLHARAIFVLDVSGENIRSGLSGENALSFSEYGHGVAPSKFDEMCHNVSELDLSPWTRCLILPATFGSHMNGITELDLSALAAVLTISPQAFSSCAALRSVSVRHMPRLEVIGESFLQHCPALERVEFADLPKLHTLGASCMAQCTSLTEVSFATPLKITRVEMNWFESCGSLTKLDTSGLTSVSSVGDRAFYGLKSLKDGLPMHILSSITVFSYYFFYGARIEQIDLSDLTSLEVIDSNVFDRVTSLRRVTLKRLPHLKKIKNSFLRNCSGDDIVVELSDLPLLTEIGACFLYGTKTLRAVHITNVPSLASLAGNFIDFAAHHATLGLDLNLRELQCAIGASFLAHSANLTTFDCANIHNVTKLGASAFENCCVLSRMMLKDMPHLTHIGDYFVKNCSALTEIRLENLPVLDELAFEFARGCPQLQTVVLSNLPLLRRISLRFLYEARQLKLLDFTNLPLLNSISDDGFCRGVNKDVVIQITNCHECVGACVEKLRATLASSPPPP